MINTINEHKTIAQIKSETEKINYFSSFNFARAVALAEFLRELESEHGENFYIITAHPVIVENRNVEHSEQIFTFGLWVKFAVNGIEYYMQLNDNPFYDAYIIRSWKIDAVVKCREYISKMNGLLYPDVKEWNGEAGTIKKLKENFCNIFNTVHNQSVKTSVYNQKEKQTIYKH